MTINKLNYEIYALDYLEGTLSPALQVEMDAFLQQHPDIAADFEAVASHRPLAVPPAPAFPQAGRLRKPITATWSRYTHWIAPIGISVLFMVAYPFWFHRTQVPTAPAAPSTPLATTSPSTRTESPIRSSVMSPSRATRAATTPLFDVGTQTPSSTLPTPSLSANGASGPSDASPVAVQEQRLSPAAEAFLALSREPRRSIILEGAAPVDGPIAAVDAPMMPFTLAARHSRISEVAPTSVAHAAPQGNLPTFAPATFAERRKWVLHASPLSVGMDVRKVAAQDEVPTPLLRIPVDETGAVRLGAPLRMELGAQYHWAAGWYAVAGLALTQRSLEYVPMAGSDLNVLALDVAYRSWSVPVALGHRWPVSARGALEWQAGMAMTWMGRRGYEPVLSGAASLDAPRTYDVFNTPMLAGKLLVVADAQRIAPTWHTQVGYTHELGHGGELALTLGFEQQMGVVNRVRLWDYDFAGQYRSDVTAFDMRFSTLRAGIAYRHRLGR